MKDFIKAGDLIPEITEKLKPAKKLTSQVKKAHHDPEAQFVKEFRTAAIKCNMIVCPIPDPKGNYDWQNYRPFDFVLVTKDNVFCIEAKVEHNNLLSHQKGTAEAIENLNPMAYWIIRKRHTEKKGTLYSIEKFRDGKKEVIMESGLCEHLVKHFEMVKVWG